MDKYYLALIINEIKNFNKLKKQFGYNDLDDLIGHYIEEGVITSREELIRVLKRLKKEVGVVIEDNTFNDWWINKRQYSAVK